MSATYPGRLFLLVAVMAVVLFLTGASAGFAQWQIESKDGESSIKFGFLAQARGEFLDSADGESTEQNLFFRRLRILVGGKLNQKFSFFFETDSPNLGKGGADGKKNAGDVFIQDFIISYNHSDNLHIDVGELLIENSYNTNQSATSLMATDYGPYSFLASGPLDERVGRDYGVRLRGYAAEKKLEYRIGVYQGLRGPNSSNPFRWVGRISYNFFEPQVGYFYQGTSLGKKKILAIGASYDTQSGYDATGVDLYLDLPVAGGNAFTFQTDLVQYDGGDFIPSFSEQDAFMVEAGYYFGKAKVLPFIQYAERDFNLDALADEEKIQVGLGFMFGGHNQNVKVSWAQISKDGAPDRDELWVNFQAFKF